MSQTDVTNAELAQKIVGAVGAVQDAQKDLVEGAKKLAAHLAEEDAHNISETVTQSFNEAVHLAGNQSISGQKTFTEPPVIARPTNDDANSLQGAPVAWVRDMLRAEVEKMSSGRNTVVRDKNDNPHVMVVIPRFNLQDIDTTLGTGPHPAFIVNGVVKNELLVGKYLASKSSNGLAQSLPHQAPWCSITFDAAVVACRALGPNFGLCTNATYAARALWMMKQLGAHEYLGNTNWGRSHSKLWQTGVMQTNAFNPGDTGNNVTAATLTGSGPVEWNDDGTPWGISDLVGNVWEWQSGLRLKAGEINIIKDNDAMLANTDHGANSAAWKAISPDGSLVNPGTANTLKFNAPAAGTGANVNVGAPIMATSIANTHVGSAHSYCAFKDLNPASGLTPPAIVKSLGLYPAQRDASIQGGFWVRNYDERVGIRGGAWDYGGYCGPFYLNLYYARTLSGWNVGFRVACLS